MSDLGEISAELNEALDRLERTLTRFGELDRRQLASVRAEVAQRPDARQVVALIDRARSQIRQAREGAAAARRAGEAWLARHGSDQTGSSPGFETAGGRAYYPPSEQEHRAAAAALPPFSGEYTLDAHGSTEHVFIAEEALSAAEVAELISADERWAQQPVRLFSCNTGRGDAPIAQELAKLLGVRVTAPDGIAWSSADGRFGVAPVEVKTVQGVVVEVANFEREGCWREFHP